MNKIKFDFNYFDGKKKYKLQKVSKTILTFLLTSSMFSGCVPHHDYETSLPDDNISDSIYHNHETDGYLNYDGIVIEHILPNEIMQRTINFESNEINNYQSYLHGIEVSYPYEELYNIDGILNKYYSTKKYNSNFNNIIKNNSITTEQLFQIVKNNNRNLTGNRVIEDKKLKEICSMICDVINDYLNNDKNIDYSLLSEKISKLKIESFSDFGYGYYDQNTNSFGFDVESSEKRVGLDKIVIHEAYHFIQSITPHDNIEYQHGFCYKYNDEIINSLNLTWYYEGSAEYLTLNRYNTKNSEVYSTLIRSFDTVKVATILDPNKKIEDFESLSLSPNLEGLFEYFNCIDEKSKKEILKMMYAFELNLDLNYISSSRDFFEKYKNIDWYDIKAKASGSIAQTLTKQFYHQLVALPNNRVSDIFSLISVFETEISRLTWYDSKQEDMQDFFTVYNDIQENFFQLLAKKLDMSVDDIINSYNSFNHSTTVDSHQINSLSKEKQEFYDYIVTTREYDKKESINVVSNVNIKRGGK